MTAIISAMRYVMAVFLVVACSSAASAQSVTQIQNVYRPNQQINIERGFVESSPAQPGWQSAQWVVEPVNGSNNVRIKNVWKGTYLNIETGALQAGAIQPGWLSAQWVIEPVNGTNSVRIKNAWKDTYLHTENGGIGIGPIQPGWQSALWTMPGYNATVAAPQQAPVQPRPVQAQPQQAPSGPEHVQVRLPQNGETQCVKNLAGIVAKVRWYRPTDFVAVPGKPTSFKLADWAQPTKTERPILLQRSCIQKDVRMVAIVGVAGHQVATTGVKIAAGTIIAVGGAVACVGTEGVACPAVVAGLTTLASGGAEFIPDAKDVFYTGAPGMIELSGTAYNPKATETRPWGKGALEGQRCEENADCRNNQCGRATAADNAPKVCCPAGSEALPTWGYDYCNKMKRGSVCLSDGQCASGNCKGNFASKKGRCS